MEGFMRNRDAPESEERSGDADLGKAILAYLRERPHAMDTLEGIAEWWVLRRMTQVEVPRVARVLRRLTGRGLLEQIGTGPLCLYRARSRRGGAGAPRARKP
jgi:hypothetical protein